MIITIDIPDQYVEILSKWASVSRTLRNNQNIINEYLLIAEDGILKDKAYIATEELDQLTVALDTLHYIARNELWKNGK